MTSATTAKKVCRYKTTINLILKTLKTIYIMIEKIWLVTQESNINGLRMSNVVPCASEETAKKIMEQERDTILTESIHYKKHNKDDFKVEEDDVHFFIQDLYDDYYEDINIEEKEIQY